jgi:hypothetical protein
MFKNILTLMLSSIIAISAEGPKEKTRVVRPTDNWSVRELTINLNAGTQATVTLTPCPLGVDTSGNPLLGGPKGGYPIWISDRSNPANSESAYVTGGTCKSEASTGTIVFTPYYSHQAKAYSLGSASSGIQEAINDACGTSGEAFRNGGCHVIVPPVGPQIVNDVGYEIFDVIFFHANGSALSGYGAILNCHGRRPCLQVGDLLNSNHYTGNTIEGISFRRTDDQKADPAFSGSRINSTRREDGVVTIETARPHNLHTGDMVSQMLTDSVNYWGDVPFITVIDSTHYTYTRANTPDIPQQRTPGVVALAAVAVLDNGLSTRIVDIQMEKSDQHGRFSHFFDFWDDENAVIEKFTNNGIPLNQSDNWTGSFVWSGGALSLPDKLHQLASVIMLKDSSVTANGSNCATVYNSNGFYVENTVCEAQGPWQFLVSNTNGNYQGADFRDIYSEAALILNPDSPTASPWHGLGIGGFIGGRTSGGYTLKGQGWFSGVLPTIGKGRDTYVYYIVARDLTTGAQTSPVPFLYAKQEVPGDIVVQWPRIASGSDRVVYDLVRNYAPAGNIEVAAGGYVAPHGANCSGGQPKSCGAIARDIGQCDGFICQFTDNTSRSTQSYKIGNGNFGPNPSFWPGSVVLTSTPLVTDREIPATGMAFLGMPTEYATFCNAYGANVSGGYTICTGSMLASNNAVPNQTAFILTDGTNTGGGGLIGAKGRLIFKMNGSGSSNPHQIITLFDFDPTKTAATTGYRPHGDPQDMYLGTNSAGELTIGGGQKGIALYVDNIGVDNNWLEHLTSSRKSFRVPIEAPTVNSVNGFQVNGSYGSPGQCLVSTGTASSWATCPGPFHSPGVENELSQIVAQTLSGSSDFSSPIPEGKCSDADFGNDANSADFLIPAWPTQLSPGLLGSMFVSANGRVTVRLCNFSGAPLAPGTLHFTAKVVHPALSNSASLSFSEISNERCDNRYMTVTGARVDDPVVPSWPPTLGPDLIGSVRVSTKNVIEVRLCNFSGKTITVPAQVFRVSVPR